MFKCLQNRGHECTSEDFSEVATGRWQLPSLGPFFFFRHAGNHVEVGLTGTDSSDADTK